MQPAARDYQPRLRWWSHLWRIALVVLIGAASFSVYAEPEWEEARSLFWIDLGVGVASLFVMQFRRRWPMTIAVVLNAVVMVSAASAGASVLASVSLATQRRMAQIIPI
ncbi:MAG TPA: histidine kinase, partial [Nocardioidaceae bacterium]|nr:histidine kinase [Nocardioidaceae bacterium]